MDRISVTLPDDMIIRLSEEVDESYDNRSEAVRDLLEKGLEYDDRITDLKHENDRLRAEKRTLIRDREERTELVKYVEREKELDQQRQQRRQAPAWRRAKCFKNTFRSTELQENHNRMPQDTRTVRAYTCPSCGATWKHTSSGALAV